MTWLLEEPARPIPVRPDNYAPQDLVDPVLFSREEYAEQLRGARVWHFRWD